MFKGKASSRRNPCPICNNTGGCKISDESILCLRGESHWLISGWKYIKPLDNGMGSLWLPDNGQQREYRPEPKPQKSLDIAPLTDEGLDRNARLILKQLGLSQKHRQKLRDRGFSDAEIDKIGFRSVEAYQTFTIPINLSFPGMGYKGNLTNKDSGYLIPIRNIKGLIIGFQIANDHPGKEDKNGDTIPKYQHLSGCSKRRVSGERPLQFLQLNDSRELNIEEGTLKALRTAYLHGVNVLGEGGCQWAASPQELKAIIDSNLFDIYILNPDTGCKANHHVMGGYRALFLFLKSFGIILYVRDWGQGDRPKSDQLDVDEIDTLTFNNARIIPFEQWAGIESEADDFASRTLTQDEWFERFGIKKAEAELSHILQKFARRLKGKNTIKPTGFSSTSTPQPEPIKPSTETSAIVLWKPQPVTAIDYIPGQLPTFEEWQLMGCPRIYIQDSDTDSLTREAYNKGYQHIKDSTPTGHGKSYDAGLINHATFGENPEESKLKLWYVAADYRNPTNITIERNFYPLEGRHDGLVRDYSRQTATGNPHLVRAKTGQSVDVPANCLETGTFQMVSDFGHHVFGGKDSPICQACPRLEEGCSFLNNRRDLLNNENRIRTDINSLPQTDSNNILIIDEVGTAIKNDKQFSIGIDDLNRTAGQMILRSDDKFTKLIITVIADLKDGLKSVTADKFKYGISHAETIVKIPTRKQIEDLIWEVYGDDWIKAGLEDNGELNRGALIWGKPEWHYEMIDGEVEAVKILGYSPIAPSIQELIKESKSVLENFSKFLNGNQSPEEKQASLKANVIPPWFPVLLQAIAGDKRINLRIENGRLIITQPSYRHRNALKNAGFTIGLDATLSKADYALVTGIKKNEILEYSKIKKDTSNLIIHIPQGLKASKQRRDTMQDRIIAGVNAIASKHQGQRGGLIDHKSAMDNYKDLAQSLKLGYWHRDTRGSNQFLDTQFLISIGIPIPNLGQMAAEWQILTGQVIKHPEQLTGRYGAWVRRKIRSELIQCVGRLRAHLRPDEQLHIYLVADLDDDTISAIRLAYPTATVTVEDVYDYAPEAATKGVQTLRGIVDAVFSAIQNGITPKITEIAEAVGKAVGTVSENLKSKLGFGFKRLIEISEMLYRALYSKTEIADLPDDARWMAETYLPNVVADLEGGHITAADVVVEVLDVPRCFGRDVGKQILAATPIPTLCKLLGVVLRFLPNQIKQELAGWIHQHYSPPLPLPA